MVLQFLHEIVEIQESWTMPKFLETMCLLWWLLAPANGKKCHREFQPTWSNCSKECGLRFSKTSQTVKACSCTRRWPRIRIDESNSKCITRQVWIARTKLSFVFLPEEHSHFKRSWIKMVQQTHSKFQNWAMINKMVNKSCPKSKVILTMGNT